MVFVSGKFTKSVNLSSFDKYNKVLRPHRLPATWSRNHLVVIKPGMSTSSYSLSLYVLAKSSHKSSRTLKPHVPIKRYRNGRCSFTMDARKALRGAQALALEPDRAQVRVVAVVLRFMYDMTCCVRASYDMIQLYVLYDITT
jgi:hypothetical protein